MSNKAHKPAAAGAHTEPGQLKEKTELAIRAIDTLMFEGPTGQMVTSMAAMVGIPADQVSVAFLLPTRKLANTRRFLASLNSTISTVLDDQVSLEEFTKQLAENIKEIQAIMAEEK